MFTWILLAIIVAALFGFIDFDKVRYWLIAQGRTLWPHAQKYAKVAEKKIKEVQSKLKEKGEEIVENKK